jgi:transcriptional regulator with XRE-family HTH domain
MTADAIRAAYLNRGLSRRQFAREVGVHEQTVRRIENGEGVHPANAKKVADALGVQVTDLMPLERQAA